MPNKIIKVDKIVELYSITKKKETKLSYSFMFHPNATVENCYEVVYIYYRIVFFLSFLKLVATK